MVHVVTRHTVWVGQSTVVDGNLTDGLSRFIRSGWGLGKSTNTRLCGRVGTGTGVGELLCLRRIRLRKTQ